MQSQSFQFKLTFSLNVICLWSGPNIEEMKQHRIWLVFEWMATWEYCTVTSVWMPCICTRNQWYGKSFYWELVSSREVWSQEISFLLMMKILGNLWSNTCHRLCRLESLSNWICLWNWSGVFFFLNWMKTVNVLIGFLHTVIGLN